jgi:beta-glucuronidase
MANETPSTEARTHFIETLAGRARSIDPTRLITAALLVRADGRAKIVDDPLGKALDVIGVNEYIGWYEQHPETADITTWNISYDKPLIVSEFRHQLPMLNRIPQLRGMSPWLLMDFRSPNRMLTGIQDEFNRKGLISERGEKKIAFYVLQKAYREQSVGKPQ